MADTLWPRLCHVRYSDRLLCPTNYRVGLLSDGAFRALMSLVSQYAGGLVWTYSAPDGKALPDDDNRFARSLRISLRRWRKIRPELEQFFEIRSGFWHLAEDWILIEDKGRDALPAAVKEKVRAREGQFCAYCGTRDTSLEFDHIFPVSRGGKDEASNLILACAPCNRSKAGRTLLEWMQS